MKLLSTVAATTAALAMISAETASAKLLFGIPWGADNRWAKNIPSGVVNWYHHWQAGYVPQMATSTEYVPTFWGPSKWIDWEFRKSEIKQHNSTHILAFNEPEIASQASMSPNEAVKLWMKELQPYAEKGINVSSPQMVYDMDWLQQFMDGCKQSGCDVSFMALHWYGSYQDMDKLQTWVKQVYQKFNLPVWVTEFGITRASNPTQDQVVSFAKEALEWFDTQPYVERAAWNGGYSIDSPPDNYATPLNALFSGNGQFRPLAMTWFPNLATKLAAQKHRRGKSIGGVMKRSSKGKQGAKKQKRSLK